ncbi:MAG: 16S rRNA (cytosine(1402)-N(4))-methyltransferase RsmH [Oscillospiraceae bacterium]|nr:16S rRNA (cytosine(1402)-N(4))-methyltransferase RsmH [Oscillospiraceae bacterium]
MQSFHKSVLLAEAVENLNVKENGIYVDATGGAGGHSVEIHKRLKGAGRLVVIDRDPEAIELLSRRFREYENVAVVRASFCELVGVLDLLGIRKIDGILLDLGVSSHQVDDIRRGFCYNKDAELDMRMAMEGISAKDIVNNYPVDSLVRIFKDYGEEKFAFKIAKNIEIERAKKNIETTFELVEIIRNALPGGAYRGRENSPKKRIFQAIRIEVNGELESLKAGLEIGFSRLCAGGRLCVITFHSLEDALVKKLFREFVGGCVCPSGFPICLCGKVFGAKVITKRPLLPCEAELKENKRAKSARLRVIERI